MKPNPGKLQIVARLMAIASLIGLMLAFAGPVGAAPDCTEFRCGQAVVDGDYSEWNVPDKFADWDDSEDFVDYMYRAFDSSKQQESALFVRYDLPTQTAYVLVLAKPGAPGIKSALDAWVSISSTSGNINSKVVTGDSGDDGVPPDFAWVGVGYDGDSNHVRGFEASFSLAPTTSKYLGAHLLVYDGGEVQTSGLDNKTVHIKTGCLLASIGDCVWHDDDRDGNGPSGCTQGSAWDSNETVIEGVGVWLLRQNTSNNTYDFVEQDFTDANGLYLFTDLPQGNYVVDVLEASVFDYFKGPYELTTDNEPYPKPLVTGEHHRHADFGYDDPDTPGPVYVGDWVWYDIDKQGDQDDGNLLYTSSLAGAMYDTGIPCVSVWLYVGPTKATDVSQLQEIGLTNTDSWGNYAFPLMKPNVEGESYYTAVGSGITEDPDVTAFMLFYDGASTTLTCTKAAEAEYVDPAYLYGSMSAVTSQRMSPDGSTTPTWMGQSLPKAGDWTLSLDYGFEHTPTAVSLQSFGGAALPALSIELTVAAAGALIAGAFVWRRRR